MIRYAKFRYIYPPRPENAVHVDSIGEYDDGEYMGQPKLNGDSMLVFTNGVELVYMNRHNQPFKKAMPDLSKLKLLHRQTLREGDDENKWIVLVGEYMGKGKLDELGNNFNGNFVIFDILVHDSVQLVGITFEERERMLDQMYGKDDKVITDDGVRELPFLYVTSVPGVYRVKTFRTGLRSRWDELVKVDMYEGLVLKRARAKLENGVSERNNTSSQVKIRKETKNYKF
jgi:ATP-dependent DNA ligase